MQKAQPRRCQELEEPVVFGRCCAGPPGGRLAAQAERLAEPAVAQPELVAPELEEAP